MINLSGVSTITGAMTPRYHTIACFHRGRRETEWTILNPTLSRVKDPLMTRRFRYVSDPLSVIVRRQPGSPIEESGC